LIIPPAFLLTPAHGRSPVRLNVAGLRVGEEVEGYVPAAASPIPMATSRALAVPPPDEPRVICG
jgi:hypothetical protein